LVNGERAASVVPSLTDLEDIVACLLKIGYVGALTVDS